MRIGLIGAGNVGWNLVAGLANSPFAITQVLSRNGDSAKALADEFDIPFAGSAPTDLRSDLDLVLIATSDHSVAEVARSIGTQFPKTVFAHTSGSIPMHALAPTQSPIGVFYPLQTFTKGHSTPWKAIPIFLEGSPQVLECLQPVAETLSERVSEMDSAGRLRLHLGAVFASNFANYMWLQAQEVVGDLPEADFSIYAPLIREVVDKGLAMGPFAAHTGPARRGDEVTMQKHLDLLEGPQRELYRLVSEMIFERFKT